MKAVLGSALLGGLVIAGFSASSLAQAPATFTIDTGEWTPVIVEPVTIELGGQKVPAPFGELVEPFCVAPGDVGETITEADIEAILPSIGCQMTSFSAAGNTMTVGVACNLQGAPIEGDANLTFLPGGRTVEADGIFQGDIAPGQSFTMRGALELRHSGACKN